MWQNRNHDRRSDSPSASTGSFDKPDGASGASTGWTDTGGAEGDAGTNRAGNVSERDGDSTPVRNDSLSTMGVPFFRRFVRHGRLFDRKTGATGGIQSNADEDPDSSAASGGILLAPLALSTTYAGVAALVGPDLFDTGASGYDQLVAFVLLGALLHLSGYSTARLYADARRVSRRTGEWRPNPYLYVCGGAIVLVGLRIAELAVSGRTVSSTVVYLAATAFVALPLASIVAGPVFWINRRRRTETAG